MKPLAAFLFVSAAFAQLPTLSPDHIRADVKFLSSDLLEGRGVGTRGGDLAADYIATQFALAGAKPAGDNGTYFQRVPLVGVTTQPSVTLSADAGDKNVSFEWLKDFVGANRTQKETDSIDADAIFMGHGISAPEFGWDDYANTDVKGKVVILFTNEPPSTDPKFFGGPALTYYGRWTYKYEEAARHGALAVLILHTTPTAGYGWDVVRSSWAKEDPQVKVTPGEHALAFAGWLTSDASEKLLSLSGHHVDELLQAANTRGFRPLPLGVRIRASIPSALRPIESRNVAAIVPGSDPILKSQLIIYSAHWDHLGIGTPVNGDKIYNGAVDNATGCGVIIEMARAWAALPQKPKRSALFLAVTAEEAGLRGSEYYAENPKLPLNKTAVDLNYDALYPFGRTDDIEVTGAERTTVWPQVQAVAQRMGLAIAPDAHPEQGSYYRSDHFSFAHAGVPSFSIDMGSKFSGKPASYGEKIFEDYNTEHYHQPSDEYREDWDFSGIAQAGQFGFVLGTTIANESNLPTWKSGDEFLAAREKSGVK